MLVLNLVINIPSAIIGRTVGRVVKALDSQPRYRGFESRRTLSLLYLVHRVPGQDLYPKCAPVHSAVNENQKTPGNTQRKLLYIDHPWRLVACTRVVCSVDELRRRWCVQVCRG